MKDLMIINHCVGPRGVFKSAVSIEGWAHRQLGGIDELSDLLDFVTVPRDMADQFRVVGMAIDPPRIGIEATNQLARVLHAQPLPPQFEVLCLKS